MLLDKVPQHKCCWAFLTFSVLYCRVRSKIVILVVVVVTGPEVAVVVVVDVAAVL